ncbi:hypothetical protein BGZ83_006506 [Gryganskiella cystojenkinii]|nr:hypothetical protein BGZ83_006506 [Gryganskiella cystojenkinii]
MDLYRFGDFVIRNLNEYVEVLERAAEWMESQGLNQWIPGTFRKQESKDHIQHAIEAKNSYVVLHTPSTSVQAQEQQQQSHQHQEPTIAAIFALNYSDPFDEMLWAHFVDPWQDAIYVHRLVVEKSFQGQGIVPHVLTFVEQLILASNGAQKFLRLDCRANNPMLRKFYREKSRGRDKSGLEERGEYVNPATGIGYARFERLVVPAALEEQAAVPA